MDDGFWRASFHLERFIEGWGFRGEMDISHRKDTISLIFMSCSMQSSVWRSRESLDSVDGARLSLDRREIRGGLMAENKLLFLEFPREQFPYSESTLGNRLRGKRHTKGEILEGEKASEERKEFQK